MPPKNEQRARKGDPTRKALESYARNLLVEAIAEFKAHSGIMDANAHRLDHELLHEFKPLLADFRDLLKDIKEDVIPYVKEQRQIIIDKRIDNREVYKTIKVWALKLVVALLALSLFYGGLQAGVTHLLPHLTGE